MKHVCKNGLVSALIGLLVLSGCKSTGSRVQNLQSESGQSHELESMTIVGKVTNVSQAWSANGDGSMTVLSDTGTSYSVRVVGSPTTPPAISTQIDLVTVDTVTGLMGKRVQVVGDISAPQKIIARTIRELAASNQAQTLVGKVTAVSSIWSGNGDGTMTVKNDAGMAYLVRIVGSPTTPPAVSTQISFLSVDTVSELVGKRVQVVGDLTAPQKITAKTIKELAAENQTFSFEGSVIEVSPIWSGNGDGTISVVSDLGTFFTVRIVGSPTNDPAGPTQIDLATVATLHELPGKWVKIEGEKTAPNAVTAKLVRELPN